MKNNFAIIFCLLIFSKYLMYYSYLIGKSPDKHISILYKQNQFFKECSFFILPNVL